jgi:hypothetical protein
MFSQLMRNVSDTTRKPRYAIIAGNSVRSFGCLKNASKASAFIPQLTMFVSVM